MDSFEQIIEICMQEQNFWTRHSVKVDLTPDEKRTFGLKTAPRPEIDVVAYNPISNELILIEAKSYLDSPGVTIGALNGSDKKNKKRFRLLNDRAYQNLVKDKIVKKFVQNKIINENPSVKFALAAGNVQKKSVQGVKEYMEKNGYVYYGPKDIVQTVKGLSNKGWEDNIVTIVSKLLK